MGRSDRMCPSPDLKRRKSAGVEKFRKLRHQRGLPEEKLFICPPEEGGGEGWRDLSWERKRERERERAALHANEAAGSTCAGTGSPSRSVNIPAAGKRSPRRFQTRDRRDGDEEEEEEERRRGHSVPTQGCVRTGGVTQPLPRVLQA